MTTSVNPTLTIAQTLVYNLLWTPFIAMGETALFAAVPVLDAPVLGAIDKEAIQELTDFVWNQLVQWMDVTTIKFLNADHQTAYESAQLKLNIIIQSQGINSDAFIQARNAEIAQMVLLTRVNQ